VRNNCAPGLEGLTGPVGQVVNEKGRGPTWGSVEVGREVVEARDRFLSGGVACGEIPGCSNSSCFSISFRRARNRTISWRRIVGTRDKVATCNVATETDKEFPRNL